MKPGDVTTDAAGLADRDGGIRTTMNDFTLRLLAIDRTSAFEREAEGHRLAAHAKRSDKRVSGRPAASARRPGIRDIARQRFLFRQASAAPSSVSSPCDRLTV
jgi:hypothetical protein